MGAARVVCTDRMVGVVSSTAVASCVAYARVLYELYVCGPGMWLSLLLSGTLRGLFLSLDRAIPKRHVEVSRLLRDYRAENQVGVHVHKRRVCRQNGERKGNLSFSTSMHGRLTGERRGLR